MTHLLKNILAIVSQFAYTSYYTYVFFRIFFYQIFPHRYYKKLSASMCNVNLFNVLVFIHIN